jgi:hypothetical protein
MAWCRRLPVFSLGQELPRYPCDELFASDNALPHYLVVHAFPLCHVFDKLFSVAFPGFVRISAVFGQYKLVADKVLLLPLGEIAGQAAPRIGNQLYISLSWLRFLKRPGSSRIEMDITGQDGASGLGYTLNRRVARSCWGWGGHGGGGPVILPENLRIAVFAGKERTVAAEKEARHEIR